MPLKEESMLSLSTTSANRDGVAQETQSEEQTVITQASTDRFQKSISPTGSTGDKFEHFPELDADTRQRKRSTGSESQPSAASTGTQSEYFRECDVDLESPPQPEQIIKQKSWKGKGKEPQTAEEKGQTSDSQTDIEIPKSAVSTGNYGEHPDLDADADLELAPLSEFANYLSMILTKGSIFLAAASQEGLTKEQTLSLAVRLTTVELNFRACVMGTPYFNFEFSQHPKYYIDETDCAHQAAMDFFSAAYGNKETRIALEAHQKDRDDRWDTSRDVIKDLSKIFTALNQSTTDESQSHTLSKSEQKKRNKLEGQEKDRLRAAFRKDFENHTEDLIRFQNRHASENYVTRLKALRQHVDHTNYPTERRLLQSLRGNLQQLHSEVSMAGPSTQPSSATTSATSAQPLMLSPFALEGVFPRDLYYETYKNPYDFAEALINKQLIKNEILETAALQPEGTSQDLKSMIEHNIRSIETAVNKALGIVDGQKSILDDLHKMAVSASSPFKKYADGSEPPLLSFVTYRKFVRGQERKYCAIALSGRSSRANNGPSDPIHSILAAFTTAIKKESIEYHYVSDDFSDINKTFQNYHDFWTNTTCISSHVSVDAEKKLCAEKPMTVLLGKLLLKDPSIKIDGCSNILLPTLRKGRERRALSAEMWLQRQRDEVTRGLQKKAEAGDPISVEQSLSSNNSGQILKFKIPGLDETIFCRQIPTCDSCEANKPAFIGYLESMLRNGSLLRESEEQDAYTTPKKPPLLLSKSSASRYTDKEHSLTRDDSISSEDSVSTQQLR